MMTKKILSLFLLGVCLFPAVYGYNFIGLKDGSSIKDTNLQMSDKITYDETDNNQASKRILGDISFINGYLWWAIWFVCFGFVVFNGFRLVTARGNADTFKKATKGLIGAVVGIVICFLSYGVVRVVIGLF